MYTYLGAFLGALIATILWTPLVIRLGNRFKILDHPGLRRIHTAPVPRLGGLAIALPVMVMVAVVCTLDNAIGQRFQAEWIEIVALLGGSAFLFCVGLTDDLRGMRARHKLYAQIFAATVVCALGIRLQTVHVDSLGTLDLGFWAWPLTILWIVGMTNAVNLIDGLDGLAAGITAITIGVVAVVAVIMGQPVMASLMLICLGSLVGFLVFNFNPARIFLGDSGTYFLGFFLGASSLATSVKSGALIGLTLPLVAMGVPIFDTLFAILRRALERRPLFSADRSHIHHRLVALGLNQKKVVFLLYFVTVLMTSFGLFMVMARDVASLVIFACIVLLLLGAFRFVGAVRLRETLAGIKQRRVLARNIHRERELFQENELRLREASDFDSWWSSLCAAAESLDFASLSLSVPGSDGNGKTRHWNRETNGSHSTRFTEISIPFREFSTGRPARIDAEVMVTDTIESMGRKLALFSRLVDNYAHRSPADASAV
jgi:UDP-GlcNAc:undecaprenyl-phosphate/decaprenyl-phosphate GlcNAc-1-phosphate transferase